MEVKIKVVDSIQKLINKINKEDVVEYGLICPICGSDKLIQGNRGIQFYKLKSLTEMEKEGLYVDNSDTLVCCNNCGEEFDNYTIYDFLYIITKDNTIYCQKEIVDIVVGRFFLKN